MSLFRFFAASLIIASGVQAQTSSASWQFPVDDGLIINIIDTIVLQWTSNFDAAYLEMWCQNDGQVGNDVVLDSSFQVNTSGTYPYVISKDAPDQQSFPVACHAQLVDAPNGEGAGPDSPVGVTFVSLDGSPTAKVFKLDATPTTTASISSTSSMTSTSSSSSSSRTSSFSSFTISSQPSTTSPTPPALTTTPPPSSKNSLSTGAKAGIAIAAVIIGLALVVGVVWLTRRNRKQSYSPGPTIPELEGKEHLGPYGDPRYGRHELQDEERRRFEMAAEGRDRPELPAAEVVYEMPADEYKRKSRMGMT